MQVGVTLSSATPINATKGEEELYAGKRGRLKGPEPQNPSYPKNSATARAEEGEQGGSERKTVQ